MTKRHEPRVLMVNPYYLPIVGGAEIQAHRLGCELVARGVRVDAVTAGFRGLAQRQVLDGINVYRLPGIFDQTRYEVMSPFAKLRAQAAFVVRVIRFLRARGRDYTILHRHTLAYPFEVTTAQAMQIKAVGKAATGGDLSFTYSEVARRFALWKPIITAANTWAVRKFDAVVSISREIADELMRLGVSPDRIHCIPNGIDTDTCCPADEATQRELRRALGLPEGPVVVYTGRLVPRKGVDVLLRAWTTCRSAATEATLLIIGKGNASDDLRQLADELKPGTSVRFMGELSDVLPWLQAADIYVMPSRQEGLPNALLEAMAVGLPIVATRIGGIVDIVEEGQSGTLVPADDVDALANALSDLLTDAAARVKLGAGARETAVHRFSIKTTVEQFLNLYDQLLN